MLNVPFASPPAFTNALHPVSEGKSRWFIFSEDKLLTTDDEQSIPDHISVTLKRKLYMGILAGEQLFAAEIEQPEQIPPGWLWRNLRTLYGVLSDEYYAMAGRAMQLLHWDRTHKYCGSCGNETFIRETERCRECPACGYLAYPKLAPAVMA